jgi:hypothetical protein
LVHGEDRIKSSSILTLQEALDQHKAVVHETGNVNELSIENLSREADVFVQSGDIVKGGQQDRIMAIDLIVPPARAGQKPVATPIAAYCVEAGRWQQRGNEAPAQFAASSAAVPGKDLEVAAKAAITAGIRTGGVAGAGMRTARGRSALDVLGADDAGGAGGSATGQQGVWQGVSALQTKLQKNLNARVNAADSPSSLQLTLETPAVKEAAKKYAKTLSDIVQKAPDVIGFVFALNGELNSAEIYGCHALFMKLWPKLLQSSAIEAVAEAPKTTKPAPIGIDRVARYFSDATSGKSVSRDLSPRVTIAVLETDKNILFETRDRARKDAWIHRSYLTK